MQRGSLPIFTRLFTVVTLSIVLMSAETAFALKIVEPTQHSALTSGQVIPARVDLGRDRGVVRVRYFWYGESDEVLVEGGDRGGESGIVKPPALISTAENEPPFGGKLRVPREAIGVMRLLAIGEVTRFLL